MKPFSDKRKFVIPIMVSLAGLCLATVTIGARRLRPHYAIMVGGGPDTDRPISRSSETNQLRNKIAAAQRRGDLKAEEHLLTAIISKDPKDVFSHQALATLLEHEGRPKEALGAWTAALTPREGVSASQYVDPTILAHWGDLAMQVNDRPTALKAYRRAARTSRDEAVSAFGNVSDLNVARRAAHAAAAPVNVAHGAFLIASDDYRQGISLLGQSWEAHRDYGRVLQQLGLKRPAKAEFKTAENLAPDKRVAADLHAERVHTGLIQTETDVVVDPHTGKATETRREIPDEG